MMTAHFFPKCKNLILKIYICKIANRQRRHSTYIYIYLLYVKPIWQGIGEYIIKLK